MISSNFSVSIKSHFFIQIALNPVCAVYDTIKSKIKKSNYILEYGYENILDKLLGIG
jgi:hypothetical protein